MEGKGGGLRRGEDRVEEGYVTEAERWDREVRVRSREGAGRVQKSSEQGYR